MSRTSTCGQPSDWNRRTCDCGSGNARIWQNGEFLPAADVSDVDVSEARAKHWS